MKTETIYGSCHTCQNQGLRNCGEADKCEEAKEYPISLREMLVKEHSKNTSLSQIAEMAFNIGKLSIK